ncbi:protein B4 isoform X1 [Poeciliopsis prolifica]|uniref:protein B4 isoform X1 n=1 Tax=Poeciliopsis prolifica TaxID=188132 RepID=UPI002413125A|nr:protein B4 isoform X1 [Poeciliopsis prolifica]
MPPKKQAADPQPSSKPASAGEPDKKKTSARAAAVRKPASHPSTAAMVREALEALDSRKGVSSQALQRYIKQTYPTVEPVRLKHLVRRVLKNGLLSGTLVRPVNATITTGALGKFRLAPKVKEVKPKSENTDPNGQKPKAGAKKTQTEDATKKKPTKEKAKSTKKPKAPKTTKDEADVPPVKKPKAKKAEAKGSGAESSEPTKNKTAKAKGAKTDKKTQNKAATSGSDAPASKTAGKRVKKTV